MTLNDSTIIFVINKTDGHLDECTLASWFRSLNGGSRWEDVEVVTTGSEAKLIARKYQTIHKLRQRLEAMEPAHAHNTAADLLGTIKDD